MSILFSIGSIYVSAQSHASNKHESNKTNYSAAYFGNNIYNPGLLLGAEFKLKEKEKAKSTTKKVRYEYLLATQLGGYYDQKSHVGLFSKNGIYIRKTNPRGGQLTYGFSPLTYHVSMLPETYEVTSQFTVDRLRFPSRGYYAPTITFGIGKLKEDKKWTANQFNLHLMFLVGYNASFIPLLNLEYGYRFGSSQKKTKRVRS